MIQVAGRRTERDKRNKRKPLCKGCLVQLVQDRNLVHVDCQEWAELLKSFDWPGDCARLELLCRFLVRNDFLHWYQLQFASDPKQWPGATEFAERELNCVRAVMMSGRQCPR